jgi:hypothetical protein
MAFGVVTGVILAAPAAQADAATSWKSSCVKPYKPAGSAMPVQSPSNTIGVMGHRAPAPNKPSWDGDDRVNDMAYINNGSNTMIAGGEFDSYIWKGTTYKRHNFVAFNTATGKPLAVAPNVDGEILTVAVSCTGAAAYLGGNFHHVNGVTRNYAAKINLKTGAVASWNPNPNGVVNDIGMMHDKLIVAGNFTKIGGAARTQLASVSQTTGKPGPWLNVKLAGHDPQGPQKVTKIVSNYHQSMAVVLGNFNTVNGKAHRRIFLLNLTGKTAALYPWATPLTASHNNSNTGTDCSVQFAAPDLDVAFTPGDTRFITASTGGPHAGSICDTLTLWDATKVNNTSAKPMRQQFTGGDTQSAVACTSENCWGSGHERWGDNPPSPGVKVTPCSPQKATTGTAGYDCKGPSAKDRPGILSVSLSTMKLNSWNPGRSRQRAMHNVFVWTPQGLFLGSDGDTVGGQNVPVTQHNDLVLWPYAK